MNKQENKKNNKGFSLVELIIVIAIMAVLIAILAPAFIRYVEQSRQSADLSAVEDIVKAVKTSAASGEVTLGSSGKVVEVNTNESKVTSTDSTDLENALKSSDVYGSSAKLKSSKWGTVTITFTETSGGGVNATVTSNGEVKMQDKYHK